MSFPNWNGVKDDHIRVLESNLASARSTIAELQKRIGELEETLAEYKTAVCEFEDENDKLEQALTAERRRREEVEAKLRAILDAR